jgi:hypothetical protein
MNSLPLLEALSESKRARVRGPNGPAIVVPERLKQKVTILLYEDEEAPQNDRSIGAGFMYWFILNEHSEPVAVVQYRRDYDSSSLLQKWGYFTSQNEAKDGFTPDKSMGYDTQKQTVFKAVFDKFDSLKPIDVNTKWFKEFAALMKSAKVIVSPSKV